MALKFEREKLLGKGGFGVVFEGNWNGNPVAVKRINLTDVDLKDLEKEETAMKPLDHPNVIRLLHVQSDQDFR